MAALSCGLLLTLAVAQIGRAQNLTCTFSMLEIACVEQHVKVTFTGNALGDAIYQWDFDGAQIIEGSGQGPFWVRWLTDGEKHVTVTVQFQSQTCTHTRAILVVFHPAIFHMTGGGSYPAGGIGVPVGLSGSQPGVIYRLRRNAVYLDGNKIGTGGPLDFGLQTEPGTYDCVAKIDGGTCIAEMEGVAVVSISGGALFQHICMVTFDTVTQKNVVVWMKIDSSRVGHFNIYKETHVNNQYEKIGEVPFSQFSTFVDMDSDPIVKSDKYKMSVTDTSGVEFEKSPHHKTIHLNISPGIYGFNLIWNHYEGFEYQTCRIHRKLDGGFWEVLDSVASNVDSYTDLYTSPGLAAYYIEVVKPVPCTPSKEWGNVSVFSNVATAAPLGVEEDELSGIMIYPNPVRDKLFLSLPGDEPAQFTLEIYRPDGRKVYESQISTGTTGVDVTGFSTGLYILKVKGNTASTVKKFFRN